MTEFFSVEMLYNTSVFFFSACGYNGETDIQNRCQFVHPSVPKER